METPKKAPVIYKQHYATSFERRIDAAGRTAAQITRALLYPHRSK